ncbi:MAG: hypothetical protein FJ293_07720 [Planctomycetes bacterium]|nr:hypothetical protein [Planctomycetota bacterium]
MKPSLAGALIALQLITTGLVVGVLLRRNEPDAAVAELTGRLERLTINLEGTLNRQAQISLFLDELRQRWQSLPAVGAPSAEPASAGPPSADSAAAVRPTAPSAPADSSDRTKPKSPFPVAAEALARLKHAVVELTAELARQGTNVTPLETEVARCRDGLIALGHQAVFVVRREIDLQPFEKDRNVDFIEYLLRQVVPPLSSGAPTEAFDLARSALVRATNEPNLKLAGAVALQQIDGDKWWKDVVDVAKLGSGREVTLRCQLLALFADHPHPSVVELCVQLLNEARYPHELRHQAIFTLAKQPSSAVNPALRRVVFEEPNHLMKNHAFDALWGRLEGAQAERAKLLEDVLAADAAQMPDALIQKATRLREEGKGASSDAPARPDGR